MIENNLIHQIIKYFSIAFSIFRKYISTVNINHNYLAIAGSFAVTVFAIAIPLSFDAISRLSNRYQSNVITSFFYKEEDNNKLRYLSLALLILILILSFFSPNNIIGIGWKLIYIITFIINIYMVILLMKYFKIITAYLIGPSYIFNKLVEEGNYIINNTHEPQKHKNKFLKINKGIGDVFIYTSKIKTNEVIKSFFSKYIDMIMNLLSLIEENNEKFNNLIVNDNFLEEWKENKDNASLILSLIPENKMTNLKIIINQFSRIHENAKFNNKEISKLSIDGLLNILKTLSSKNRQHIFIRIILERLIKIFNQNINDKIETLYKLSISWYINFLNFRNDMSLEYIELYNNNLKKSISLIIKNKKERLFKSLIGSLIDGTSVVFKDNQDIYSYTDILLITDNQEVYENNNLEEMNKNIINKSNKLYTYDDYKTWFNETNYMKSSGF